MWRSITSCWTPLWRRHGLRVLPRRSELSERTNISIKDLPLVSKDKLYGQHFASLNTRWVLPHVRVALLKRLTYATLGVSAIGFGLASVLDDGFKRNLIFNATIMPIFFHYRWVEYCTRGLPADEADSRFQDLHNKYVNKPLQLCLRLKGFYIKIGQVMSSFGGNVLPHQYVNSLKVLQDQVPPEPGSYARKVIEESIGCRIEDIFLNFDDDAMAAASIGQVHRATLLDGTEVVVKVQYPNVEHFFTTDINTMKRFCRMAAPEQLPLLDEVQKQFLTEFDYKLESSQMREIATNITPHFADVVIPLPIDSQHPSSPIPGGLCTKEVLVMEMLKGTSLVNALRSQLSSMAQKEGKTVDELEREFRKNIEQGLDVPTPPSTTLMRLLRFYLKTGDVIHNTFAAFYNWTFGWIAPTISYISRKAPLDVSRLINLLFDVHGHQLFVDSMFNGDCHPGNVMLLDDGRLGLIDFGQVKRMSLDDRIKLARVIVALADRDEKATAQHWKECGFKTVNDDPYVVNKWAQWMFSRMTPDVVDELGGIALFQENLEKLDKLVELPSEFIMAFRMSALLRANAMSMGHTKIDAARMWRDQAVDLLKRHGEYIPETVFNRNVGSSM